MIDERSAALLRDRLETAKKWPLPSELPILKQVAQYVALREADADALRPKFWDSDRDSTTRDRRRFIVDPLPARVAGAFADLIFGEEPEVLAGAEGDQARLDEIVEVNELASELQHAEIICASEGEVWWRILVDQDVAPAPLIDWHSRLSVVPLMRSRRVLAVAFVSELADPDDEKAVYRYVNLHADGLVLNLLYLGKDDKLGEPVELAAHPDVADLPPDVRHELPMLAGKIINKRGHDPRVGQSQYHGVVDLFKALNESTSIGQENMQLTAKQRVVIPQSYLDRNGRFPAGAEVIIATQTDAGLDDKQQGLAQVEWSFDAEALELYKNGQIDTALTRCRVAPQLVGRHTEDAATGPALRARLLDSVLAANGMARPWDDRLPVILGLCQQVSALPDERGGLGQQWAAAATPPTVERASVLPEDLEEKVQRHAIAIGAEIESRETAVRDLHADWDDAQVSQELARIKSDTELAGDPPPPPGERTLATIAETS